MENCTFYVDLMNLNPGALVLFGLISCLGTMIVGIPGLMIGWGFCLDGVRLTGGREWGPAALLTPIKDVYRGFFTPYLTRDRLGNYNVENTPGFTSLYFGSVILVFLVATYAAAATALLSFVLAMCAGLMLLSPWLLIIPAIPFVVATVLSIVRLEFRVVTIERRVRDAPRQHYAE